MPPTWLTFAVPLPMAMFCLRPSPLYWVRNRTSGSSPTPPRNTGSWWESTATSRNSPFVSMATSRLTGVPENPGTGARSIDSKA